MDSTVMQEGLEVNYQNQDDEEAEFEREEIERQNELRVLLTDALDADDLLDDDDEDESTCKSVSRLSHDYSNGGDDESELSWPLDIAPVAHHIGLHAVQTSTPRNPDCIPPVFKTPATDFNPYFQPAAADEHPQAWHYQRSETDAVDQNIEAGPNHFTPQPHMWRGENVHQNCVSENTVRQVDLDIDEEDDDRHFVYTNDEGQQYYESADGYNVITQPRYGEIHNDQAQPNSDQPTRVTCNDGRGYEHPNPMFSRVPLEQNPYGQLYAQQQWTQQMYELEQEDVTDVGQLQIADSRNYCADDLHIQCGYSDIRDAVETSSQPQWSAAAEFPQVFSSGAQCEYNTGGTSSGFESNMLSTWPMSHSAVATATGVSSRSVAKVTGKDGGEFDSYRVQYRQQGMDQLRTTSAADAGRVMTADQTDSQAVSAKTAPERLQQAFLQSDEASTWSEREAQMRVLLDAKGHKIEELQFSLNEAKDSAEREIRIMKHQLLMMTDERDGLAQSLHQSELLVQEKQTAVSQLNGQTAALQSEISSLKQNKDDMIKKVMTLESMVESLNAELAELGSSDALSRAKQQHESVVAGMRQKFDSDLLAANNKVDSLSQKLTEREELVSGMKKQIAVLEKTNKTQLQENAEEINRLHRCLKESQQECRELLESQGTMELSRLKMKLQDAIASKTLVDDVNTSLQSEIRELKEHVRMYEMASQCSAVLSGNKSTSVKSSLDDSYAQLGIKKSTATVSSSRSGGGDSGVMSADEALHGLKTELERCLKKCQGKSEQMTKLQTELKTCKATLAENNVTLELLQKQLQETKSKAVVSETDNRDVEQMQLQIHSMTTENASLKQQLEEVRSRLTEAAESEARVTDINVELNQQLTELLQQNTNQTEDMIHSEQTDECRLVEQQQQQQLTQLQQQMSKTEAELIATKDLYVSVCKLKDDLEQTVQTLQVEKAQAKVNERKALADQQKEFSVEIGKRVQQVVDEYDAKLLTVSQELDKKWAGAVSEKAELEGHIKTMEQQLTTAEQQHRETLAELTRHHKEELETLKKHRDQDVADVETEHKRHVTNMETQHEAEITELEKCNDEIQAEMGKLRRQTSAQIDQLMASNAALQIELNSCRKTFTKLDADVTSEGKVKQGSSQAENLPIRNQPRSAEDGLRDLDSEHATVMGTNNEFQDSLERKVKELERKVEEAERQCKEAVTREHDSMQRERDRVVASLQQKLAEKTEKQCVNPAVDTQVDWSDAERLKLLTQELTEHCVSVMHKMKVAMLVYVKDAKHRDAVEFNDRLTKDRHTTARNLRSYYLKCLSKLLDADFDHTYKAQFLKRMGRLLDNLPEKDVGTASQCTTPSIQSSSASPRDEDSASSTPRSLTARSKPTDVPRLALCTDSDGSKSASTESTLREHTSSLPSTSTTTQYPRSVGTTEYGRALNVSSRSLRSTYVSGRSDLSSASPTHSAICTASVTSMDSGWSHSSSSRHLPHFRRDVAVTRDVLPSCITTPSSSGKGGLSSYSTSLHHGHSASADGLDRLRPSSAPQCLALSHNKPIVSSDRHRPPASKPPAAYTEWITTRN